MLISARMNAVRSRRNRFNLRALPKSSLRSGDRAGHTIIGMGIRVMVRRLRPWQMTPASGGQARDSCAHTVAQLPVSVMPDRRETAHQIRRVFDVDVNAVGNPAVRDGAK